MEQYTFEDTIKSLISIAWEMGYYAAVIKHAMLTDRERAEFVQQQDDRLQRRNELAGMLVRKYRNAVQQLVHRVRCN